MRTASLRPTKFDQEHDLALIERILAGDDRAFTELYEEYHQRLLHHIMRIVRDDGRSEDLVQETFIRVSRHIRRFDRACRFSTWIFTIASNLAYNEIRDISRNPILYFSTLYKADIDEDTINIVFPDTKMMPDRLFEKRELRMIVMNTVDKLPEHHRQIFKLRHSDGLTYEEMAARLNCNLGTVKSRLNRARNAFAAMIEKRVA